MRRRRLPSETQNSPPHAEEIASFPAPDGRSDWTHFGGSPTLPADAGDSTPSVDLAGSLIDRNSPKSNQAIREEYLKMLSELEHRVLALRIEQDRWAEWRAQEEEKLADAVEQIEDKEAECESLRIALDDREKTLADALVNMKREAVRMDRRNSEIEVERKHFVVKIEKQRTQIKKLRSELRREAKRPKPRGSESESISSSASEEGGDQSNRVRDDTEVAAAGFVSPAEKQRKRPVLEQAPPSLQLRVESPDKTVYNVFYSSRAPGGAHLRCASSPQEAEQNKEPLLGPWTLAGSRNTQGGSRNSEIGVRNTQSSLRNTQSLLPQLRRPLTQTAKLPEIVSRRRPVRKPVQEAARGGEPEHFPDSSSSSLRDRRAPSAPQVSATDIIRGVRRSLTSLKSNDNFRQSETHVRQTASSPEDISAKLTRFVDKAAMRVE